MQELTRYILRTDTTGSFCCKGSLRRREANPGYTGNEEFNYFLSVLFPDEELMIMPYNRVVKDLNGLSEEEFMAKIKDKFNVSESSTQVAPSKKGEFGMYLAGNGTFSQPEKKS